MRVLFTLLLAVVPLVVVTYITSMYKLFIDPVKGCLVNHMLSKGPFVK
jgi:hypothetical protein